MKKKRDKIWGNFGIAIVSVFIALTVMLAYTFISFYNSSISRINEIAERNLDTEAALIENYVNKGFNVLWVTADTVDNLMVNGYSNDQILKYLESGTDHMLKEVDENFTGIYGYINGEYLDGIGWVPPEGYDPITREWYKVALEGKGETVIVSPYLDAQTNTIMISVSKLLSDGVSVVSLDIALNQVQSITESLTLNNMGYGFIMNEEGLIIAHRSSDEKGKIYPLNEEQKYLVTNVFAGEEKTFDAFIDGKNSTVFSKKVLGSWYVVMVVDKDNLYHDLRRQIVLNSMVCLVVFIVIASFLAFAYRLISLHQLKEKESKDSLEKLNTNIVKALAYTIDAKDRYTSGHSQRVANYSLELAKRLGKTDEELQMIYYAGLLHDVGKIRVPGEVINKPGKLTDEEFNQIKIHPVSGFHILKDIYEDKRIANGAKYHHERYDGKGYPNALEGENIPEIARIIGVADAYDAMASNRSYRNALPQDVVRKEIEKGRGFQFDPKIADVMLTMIDEDKNYEMCQTASMERTILLVDDEKINVKIVKAFLKNESGYEIDSVNSGKEALEYLENNKVDLILLDLQMPEMNGFEVYDKIREKWTVPVVLMTGDKTEEIINKCAELGIVDYLTKPILPVALKETIHGSLYGW